MLYFVVFHCRPLKQLRRGPSAPSMQQIQEAGCPTGGGCQDALVFYGSGILLLSGRSAPGRNCMQHNGQWNFCSPCAVEHPETRLHA